MAALQRAVALAEVDAVAVRIEEKLDLDVTGAVSEALEEDAVVAEARPRPRRRASASASGRSSGRSTRAHAAAAAAGRGLHEQREAELRGRGEPRRRVREAGHDRHAGRLGDRAGRILSPSARIASGGGADTRSPAATPRSANAGSSPRNP